MATFTKGNGSMGLRVAEGCIMKPAQELSIAESGKMAKEMAMEYSSSQNRSFMREPLLNRLSMVMVLKDLPMVIFIVVNIARANSMAKGNIFGQMVHHMREDLLKDVGMGKVTGNPHEPMATFISDRTREIKRAAMEDMCGQMDAFMKVNSKAISSTSLNIQKWQRSAHIPRRQINKRSVVEWKPDLQRQ